MAVENQPRTQHRVERHSGRECPHRRHHRHAVALGHAERRAEKRLRKLRGQRVGAQPRPHRARERRVRHDTVPTAAGHVGPPVLEVLANDVGVRLRLLAGVHEFSRYFVRHVVIETASHHVRHVDAPSVEPVLAAQPASGDRITMAVHHLAQGSAAEVQLDERAHAEPGGGALGAVGAALEIEVLALRRVGNVPGALVPRVRCAAVVEREVAHHAHVPRVRLLGESFESGIAAEQRVDVVERCCVVAMRAARGEKRGQVDDVGAESCDVVEVLGRPVQVAAEELAAPVRALRQFRPRSAHGPLGLRHVELARREAVRKHLVNHRLGRPLRVLHTDSHDEVVGIRRVVRVKPGRVQPRVGIRVRREQEPVRHQRIHERHVDGPPRLDRVATLLHHRYAGLLAVMRVPQRDGLDP